VPIARNFSDVSLLREVILEIFFELHSLEALLGIRDNNTLAEPNLHSDVLDPHLISIGYDHACFEGLQDPPDSRKEVCKGIFQGKVLMDLDDACLLPGVSTRHVISRVLLKEYFDLIDVPLQLRLLSLVLAHLGLELCDQSQVLLNLALKMFIFRALAISLEAFLADRILHFKLDIFILILTHHSLGGIMIICKLFHDPLNVDLIPTIFVMQAIGFIVQALIV
jgi:hypothetical protein